MRTFLGFFMVLIVGRRTLHTKGDDANPITITATMGDSVLLPCPCPERDLDRELKWQMEELPVRLVLKYSESLQFYGTYKDRVTIFLPKESDNCSIVLSNITADDLGKYRCTFRHQKQYKYISVILNITANYSVCQNSSVTNRSDDLHEDVFLCFANGSYGEAEIQWRVEGQLLSNSSTTQIIHMNTLDATTGFYQLTSQLITKVNGTSEPKCQVNAKRISTINLNDCGAGTGRLQTGNTRYQFFKFIPIVLALVSSLCLWRRWNSHR